MWGLAGKGAHGAPEPAELQAAHGCRCHCIAIRASFAAGCQGLALCLVHHCQVGGGKLRGAPLPLRFGQRREGLCCAAEAANAVPEDFYPVLQRRVGWLAAAGVMEGEGAIHKGERWHFSLGQCVAASGRRQTAGGGCANQPRLPGCAPALQFRPWREHECVGIVGVHFQQLGQGDQRPHFLADCWHRHGWRAIEGNFVQEHLQQCTAANAHVSRSLLRDQPGAQQAREIDCVPLLQLSIAVIRGVDEIIAACTLMQRGPQTVS